jgi:L-asparaginase / beta-aspartyl-peptidase
MTEEASFALAVHGGAGTLARDHMTPEREAAYHAALRRALIAGRNLLVENASALDAVTAAVVVLEDDPLFNAGCGAVFTSAGTQEMDAAIMEGRERRAGAVAGIVGPKNPILVARAVMQHSPHVLMIGEGALKLAREQQLAFADFRYFYSEPRWQALQETLAQGARHGDENGHRGGDDEASRHGTVGAVARDRRGDLAAATSTGGITGKLPGRVGDTPIIGAGTYADNASCAISATGDGEFFIRIAAAHEIAARVRFRAESLAAAAAGVVEQLNRFRRGSGGLIAVGRNGELALPYNSPGMYRGYVESDGIVYTAIFDEAYRSG